jgi:hypothetical protein
MSRAYRIRLSQTLGRVVHVDDSLRAPLELLPVLPAERMLALLGRELERRGFEIDAAAGTARRAAARGVTVEVDLRGGEVNIRIDQERDMTVSSTVAALPDRSAEDQGLAALAEALRGRLEERLDDARDQLRRDATARLEGQLGELRAELDGAINHATAEALKERARQLGEVEEVNEDPETGSLTIRVRL